MPSGLLLLPLIGGYFFLTLCNRTRFYFRKHEGHRLYLNAAALGIVLLLLSRAVVLALAYSTWSDGLQERFQRFAPFDFSGVAFGSLLLGFLLPWLFNLRLNGESSALIPLAGNRHQTLTSVANKTDELLALFLNAQEERHPVLVCTENGKAYVGYVLMTAHLAPELPYVKIVPTVSGYRSKDELELELRNVYKESQKLVKAHYDKKATPDEQELLRKLQIVLKREKILSASFFNEKLYKEHQADREQRRAKVSSPAAPTTRRARASRTSNY